MFVEHQNLVDELSGAGGEPFEQFMHGLVQAEAATHGIMPTDIDWDYRVNCADGGCDIFIKKGHGQPNARFIPAVPSIWSLKSGDNGTKAATLRAELTDSAHDRLRRHLKDGDVYLWCGLQPISQPKRQEMVDEVASLAKELGFDPAKVQFRWVEAIASTLEAHPNLIAKYLPLAARRLNGVFTLNQWCRASPDCRGFDVNWIGFSGRDQIKLRVQEHLLGQDGPSVLHIAGLSGIGKTRTAVQACHDNERLADTLYVAGYDNLSEEFLRHIESPGRYIRAIVDEVSLEEYQRLSDRFRDHGNRIRLLTLGPATRQIAPVSNASVLVMEEPGESEGVLQIVKEAGQNLAQDVQESIARVSGHDLRLALLLVQAVQQTPDLKQLPLYNLDDVWTRVTRLFSDSLGRVAHFPALFEKLTVAIDVGRRDSHRSELEHIAKHFGTRPEDLDCAIEVAARSGLGLKTLHFFEAMPRALAVWVFADRLWGALEPTVDAFLNGMPTERLRRRFIQRCQELQGPRREEVLDRVGQFFLSSLGEPNLMRLAGRETSRVFEAWAELDPERALPWLVDAAEHTGDEQLREFDAASDGNSSWRSRRHIVWLCEHLACFKEYFWGCERILFRLAQVETEESIGNNSRSTWKEMFLPVLSHTEVPFPERVQHLARRLRDATEQTMDLVLSAALGVLEYHGFRLCPPRIVGGRLVPDEWQPRTQRELSEVKTEAGRTLLLEVSRLRPDLQGRAILGVIGHMSHFLYHGLLREVQNLLRTAIGDDELQRALRAALDQVILRAEDRDGEENRPAFLPDLKQWRQKLNPLDLRGRIIDLTSRDAWSVHHDSDKAIAVYRELALAVLGDITVLEALEGWFSSKQCRSGPALGIELANADERSLATPLVLRWISAARAVNFAGAYLGAISYRPGGLPAEAVRVLDDLAERQPLLATALSVEADRSPTGFERIMTCLRRLDPGQRGVLRSMASRDWPEILDEDQKDRLLADLEALACSTDPAALGVAFDLLAAWTRHGKVQPPDRLAARGLHMLRVAAKPDMLVDDYDWKILTELLLPQYPRQVARLLAHTIVDLYGHHFGRARYAAETLKKLAASRRLVVMEVFGPYLLNKKTGPSFCFWEHRGLFDAIGLEIVRPWVLKHGKIAAIRIARHLDGPRLDDKGNRFVPDLANWLLTEFEGEDRVFREFCMGRYSGVVRSGDARDRAEEIEKLVKPFLTDSKKWIQDWVKFERENLEWEIQWSVQRDEEHERL